MALPRPRPFLHVLALALAAIWLGRSLGGVEAACAVPGDLVINGIDCLVFDPATSTTIVANLTDPNLSKNTGGRSYLQVGFRSAPDANSPVNDIGFRANNETTYQLFSTNDTLSEASPNYGYTSIDQFYSTNPSFVQFTIPGGYVVNAGESYQLILLTNTDGFTNAEGALARGIGNDYAAIPRDFYSIPRTDSPTGAPSSTPTPNPTSSPTTSPSSAPTVAPTVGKTAPQSVYCIYCFQRVTHFDNRSIGPRPIAYPTHASSPLPSAPPTAAGPHVHGRLAAELLQPLHRVLPPARYRVLFLPDLQQWDTRELRLLRGLRDAHSRAAQLHHLRGLRRDDFPDAVTQPPGTSIPPLHARETGNVGAVVHCGSA